MKNAKIHFLVLKKFKKYRKCPALGSPSAESVQDFEGGWSEPRFKNRRLKWHCFILIFGAVFYFFSPTFLPHWLKINNSYLNTRFLVVSTNSWYAFFMTLHAINSRFSIQFENRRPPTLLCSYPIYTWGTVMVQDTVRKHVQLREDEVAEDVLNRTENTNSQKP